MIKNSSALLIIGILGESLIIGIFSMISVSGSLPIGCEEEGAFLHCWNNGTIEPSTYYNTSSGGVQHANTIPRADDAYYIFGYARKTGATYSFSALGSIPGDLSYFSDGNTYYWLKSGVTIGQHTFIKNSTQELNDDMVKMRFSYKSTNAILGNSYFVTGIWRLDVNNDGNSERIILELGNGSVEEWDNRTGTKEWPNVTRIIIDGGPGSYAFDMNFSKGVITVYNHTSTSTNGDFLFLDYIGTVAAGTWYNFTYLWVDAVCAKACPSSCTMTYTDTNATSAAYYTQGTTIKRVGCRPVSVGFTCGLSGCSLSADCRMDWIQYPGGGVPSSIINSSNTDYALKCKETGDCYNTSMLSNVFKYQTLITGAIGNSSLDCRQQTGATSYIYLPYTWPFYKVSRGNPSSTIWSPANNTKLNSTLYWAIFGVNNTGNITADNITLYFNNSANYTSAPNLTVNWSFYSPACWVFTARACYSHNCPYSTSGNFTICQIGTVTIIIPAGQAVTLPPKKRDGFHQLDVEDKGILAIGAAIIFVGVFLTLWRAKSTKQGDLVGDYSGEIKK